MDMNKHLLLKQCLNSIKIMVIQLKLIGTTIIMRRDIYSDGQNIDFIGTFICTIGILFLSIVGLFLISMIRDYIRFMRKKNDIY